MISDIRTHPDRYVTPAELADYWNISMKTVQRWIDAGKLQAEQIHGQVKIATASVRQYERRPVLDG